jgi:hypothetical protein
LREDYCAGNQHNGDECFGREELFHLREDRRPTGPRELGLLVRVLFCSPRWEHQRACEVKHRTEVRKPFKPRPCHVSLPKCATGETLPGACCSAARYLLQTASMKLLRTSETTPGGGGPESGQAETQPTAPPGPQPPAPTPAPPPAAQTVLTGEKSEETRELEAKLESARKKQRELETDNAFLQDKLHTLTAPPQQQTQPEPPPAEDDDPSDPLNLWGG